VVWGAKSVGGMPGRVGQVRGSVTSQQCGELGDLRPR
jgi:hypothetical protein